MDCNPMMITSHWPSPAKLNLFLYVNGRLPNGYHELQTLFQFIDRCDTLSITPNHSGEITLANPLPGVANQDNLIWKAARALQIKAQQDSSQRSLGAHIEIAKILPMGGGIGGGSSNAATTLVALNELWQLNYDFDTLAEIGLHLGADVPIFVRGHAAFAEGVGEKIVPVDIPERWFVVVRPKVSIATAEIFQHPDLTRNTPKQPMAQLIKGTYGNDCEKIVRLLYPEVDKQLSWLLQYAPSRLTGTGSCVYAEFSSKSQAETVLAQLSDSVSAFVAQGRNVSPLIEALADYRSAKY
ncbi:4-(cytidine 5'-diphospho)-2-C-methyl-D-erythritol kinase [Vibrio sp. SM6]|uniref:4-diphosphocytidyl-2-C-methyl-D-erythritol kinase n=1 Tax=Vibrio agarilyticus TaxID=2726741 RepID=A0A7X8TN87_9VIBR|nr:4-(cytidine 5'-diphospho)-2-C-methyl-D-erythritol kinase [Vibrio agarilyticus]NLS11654.1 4-(cytidine 5'-diphospho)-2-C-methyl-D-erythritol kinase [Vibrio agarilyticus]